MITLPEVISIFPLSEVVLFPETLAPLHIFEPRYREMLAAALDDDRTIGMVLIRQGDPAGSPEVYPIGCAGRVVEHRALTDGRSLIILRGTVRFRITRELATDTPYRKVEAQALYEAPVPAERMRGWRDELRRSLGAYASALVGKDEPVEDMFRKLELEGLVNYLSASLPLEVLEKQSLMECATAEKRFRRLCDIVEFKTAEAKLGLHTTRTADA